MASITGIPLAAQLVGSTAYLDKFASQLKATYAAMGTNAAGESGTGAVAAYNAYANILALLPSNGYAIAAAGANAMRARWDQYWVSIAASVMTSIDNQTSSGYSGTGVTMVNNTATYHALDAHLLRINACHSGTPLPLAAINYSSTTVSLATATNTTTLTDSGRSWTSNIWTGMTIAAFNTSGVLTYGVVTSNTGTVATCSGGWTNGTPASTSAYIFQATAAAAAVANANGALSAVSSGNAPDIVVTAVGTNDYDESIPIAVIQAPALSGANDAYSLTLAGTVPTPAPKKLRVYRTAYAGHGGGVYGRDQDVTVTVAAAGAWSSQAAIILVQPDTQIRFDFAPPSFCCALVTPECAYEFAAAYAKVPASNATAYYNGNPPTLSSIGMLNPANVALNPSNAFLGLANPANSAQFGSTIIGTGFTASTIQGANNSATGLQGYIGGLASTNKIQARATTTLNGARTPTISMTYYDALHPGSNAVTVTSIAADSGFAGSIAGETITFSVTPGRLITAISETSSSGGATVGTYVYESPPVRVV